MPWTPPRIALVACAAASALAMLYVGLFQIGWLSRLACPGFGSGCESVALSRFSYPLGFADGLLAAALCGLIAALAQVRGREAAIATAALAFVNLIANLIGMLEMQKLGAYCLWCTFSAILSAPIAVLSVACARSGGGGRAAAPAVAPEDRPQQ